MTSSWKGGECLRRIEILMPCTIVVFFCTAGWYITGRLEMNENKCDWDEVSN